MDYVIRFTVATLLLIFLTLPLNKNIEALEKVYKFMNNRLRTFEGLPRLKMSGSTKSDQMNVVPGILIDFAIWNSHF